MNITRKQAESLVGEAVEAYKDQLVREIEELKMETFGKHRHFEDDCSECWSEGFNCGLDDVIALIKEKKCSQKKNYRCYFRLSQ